MILFWDLFRENWIVRVIFGVLIILSFVIVNYSWFMVSRLSNRYLLYVIDE